MLGRQLNCRPNFMTIILALIFLPLFKAAASIKEQTNKAHAYEN
jgi:hypothetical protein